MKMQINFTKFYKMTSFIYFVSKTGSIFVHCKCLSITLIFALIKEKEGPSGNHNVDHA